MSNHQSRKFIAFGYGYTHGKPFVEVKFAFHDGQHPVICIIQAQGESYCHGIIMNHSMLKVSGTKDMKIWNYIGLRVQNNIFSVNSYDWMRYDNTGVANSPSVINEKLISNSPFGNNSLLCPDSKPYLKFAGDNSNIGMIYQYRKLDPSVKVGQLIDYIVEDVKRLIL